MRPIPRPMGAAPLKWPTGPQRTGPLGPASPAPQSVTPTRRGHPAPARSAAIPAANGIVPTARRHHAGGEARGDKAA